MRMSATNQQPITEAVVKSNIIEDVASPPFNQSIPASFYSPPPSSVEAEAAATAVPDISEAAPAAAAARAAPSTEPPPETSHQPSSSEPPLNAPNVAPPAPPATVSAAEITPMEDEDLGLRPKAHTPAHRVKDKPKKSPSERWQEARKREREEALQRSSMARTSRLYPGKLDVIQEEEEEEEQAAAPLPPLPPSADPMSDSSQVTSSPAQGPSRTTSDDPRRGHRRVTRRRVIALPATLIKKPIKKTKPPSVRVEPVTTEGTEKKTKRHGQQQPTRRPPSVKVKPYREFYEGGETPFVVARPRSRRDRQRLELDPNDTRKILKLNEDAKDVKYRLWTQL